MFTLISDQTAWYNKQSDKLRAVSKNMNMEHAKGRDKELRRVHRSLTYLLSSLSIMLTLKKAFSSKTEKLEDEIHKTNAHIIYIERQIIKNNYQDTTFVNGAAIPISKQTNPYSCMHKNKLHEHMLKQCNVL